MTQRKPRAIRIPINVTFYDKETGRQVVTHLSTIKTKIRRVTADTLAQNANCRMECKVTYSKEQDSWNRFEFTTMADFDKKLAPCLEIEMLRELEKTGMLDTKHMTKRKR